MAEVRQETAAGQAETPAKTPPTTPTGKRPSLVSRHSSNNSATLSASAQQAKPKVHLVGKRNRSSGQLSKLTKSHSAKNLTKAGLKPTVKFKRTSSHTKLLDIGQPAADDWVEEESSTATTKAKAAAKRPEIQRAITEPAARAGDSDEHDNDNDNDNDNVSNSGNNASATAAAIPTSANADYPPRSLPQASIPENHHPRHPNRNVSFRLEPTGSRVSVEPVNLSSGSGNEKNSLIKTYKRRLSLIGQDGSASAMQLQLRASTKPDDSDVSPKSVSSPSPPRHKERRRGPTQSSDGDNTTTTSNNLHRKNMGKGKVTTEPNVPVKQTLPTTGPFKSAHKYLGERDESREPHLHSPFQSDIRGSSRTRLISDEPYDSGSEDQGSRTSAREYTISHDELVKRHKQYREADETGPETHQREGTIRGLLEDASITHQGQRSSGRSREVESSFEEAGPDLAHEPTMSRTQFRLNLERQHTLNFREPRQRPVGWPDSTFGERRIENLKTKPSVWRAVREARKDLENVRELGQDPLRDAIDAVGYKGLGTTKKKDPPRALPKRSIWAGRKTMPPKQRAKEGPIWEYEARVAAVESVTAHCQRLWSTPAVSVGDD